MSILLIAPKREMAPWKRAIQEIDPQLEVEIYPEVSQPGQVKAAVLWNHPEGCLSDYPNLKWASSLGAGVDHILRDPDLPEQIRITRIVDPGIPAGITRMIITMLTDFEKGIFQYREDQKNGVWKPVLQTPKLEIGLLGMGEIGMKVADILKDLGYSVRGLSFQGKPYKEFSVYEPNALHTFLSDTNVVVCLLPHTTQTENWINRDFFSMMKEGSYFMNLARGKILVEEDLLWAIEKGFIEKAYLDVFRTEPLPPNHPFWENERIIITPHISGITDVHTAAKQIVNNYYTFEKSGDLKHEIDKKKGY